MSRNNDLVQTGGSGESKPAVVIYAVTIGIVATAALLRMILEPILNDGAPLSTFVIAVCVCAWFGGLRSAVLAMFLGFLTGWFLFITPHTRYIDFSLSYQSRYAMYFVICCTIATFGEAMRRAHERSKTSERIAQQKAETLRITFASIADGVITTDGAGKITYLNAVAENLTGWTNDEAVNQPLQAVFNIIDDQTRQVIENPVQNVLKEGRFFGPANRTILIARNGVEKPIDERAASIIDDHGALRGVIVVFRDISERKRAEEEVNRLTRASEQQYRIFETALSSSADFNYVFDLQGRFVYVNKPLLTLWQKDLSEAVGRNFFELGYSQELAAHLQRQIQRVIDTRQPVRDETAYTSSTGERQYEYIFVPVIGSDGNVEAVAGSTRDITERKQAEIAVRESEQRIRQLADAMPQIVWTAGADGNIDYQNHQWYEFINDPNASGNDAWTRIIHPDDAPEARDRWETSVKTGSRFEMEIRLMDQRSRMYRWYLIRTVAVFDDTGQVSRWFGTGTDIHEQKLAERKSRYLAESSSLLASVTDYESTLQQVANLAVPYFADWSVVDVANESGRLHRLAVAHRDPSKIQFAKDLDKHYPTDPQAPHGIGAAFRTGVPELVCEVTDEHLIKTARDERHLQLFRSLGLKSFICVPLVASSHILGVITFATAESERTYSDADLALAKDLAHRAAVAIENTRLYQALRDADRRKDEFLATLAHELRNPLAPIRNSLQILNMPRVDAATSQQVRDVMERQIHHLVRLVDDLLDVSRVMRGKIELRKETVELATIVARAIETVHPLIETQEHRIELSLPDEPLLTHVDPVRMTQVVGNLLTNAAKYTEINGHIWISAERDNDTAILRVRDSGIGIAPEMLPSIFELFVQADHSSTRSQGGLGIGLTLARNLVEMHGGSVQASSPGLGKGSEFVVRLPLTTIESHYPERIDSPKPKPSLSARRLLVVDDNKDAAVSLAMLLRLQGHEVELAHDGSSAVDVAKSYRPELVFLDIGMPGMDGYEVARRIRQTSGLEKIVLAALTGWGQSEDRRRTAEAGFDHHLIKPPDPKALESVLADLSLT